MKHRFIMLLMGLGLMACNQPVDVSKTVVEGKIKGMENGVLNVSYVNEDGYAKDTVGVREGKFTLTLPVDFPTELTLSINQENFAKMWTEPGVLHLTLTGNQLGDYKLQGSKTNELAMEFEKQVEAENGKVRELSNRMQTGQLTEDEKKEIIEQYHKLNDTIVARGLRMVAAHPDSYYSASLLWDAWWQKSIPVDEAQQYLGLFSGKMAEKSPYLRRMRLDIEGELHGKVGQKAPDFSTTDIHGNAFQLSQLFGDKCVIIDFWASWCKPCRASNPHLKALYEKYKKDGLVVVCVADNDSMLDVWKKAVIDDGLEDFIHVLRGYRGMEYFFNVETDISNKYGVHSLPTKFLIDKNGVIVGRYGENGDAHEAMDVKLKEVFGY